MDGTAARVAARESGDARVKSLDAFSNEIEDSEYHLVFGMRIKWRLHLHLQCALQPRRQMNCRDHAASAAATKLNGRKVKRHQVHVAG